MPSIQVVQDKYTLIRSPYHDVVLDSGIVKRLAVLPQEKYSDHELMLIKAPYFSALSYNIGEAFELKSGTHSGNSWYYINNGFMIEHESLEEFSQRMERIFQRIALTSDSCDAKLICLQEASKPEIIGEFLVKYFGDFIRYQEGSNIILIKNNLVSNILNLQASEKRKIMAVYIKDFNLIVINIHAAWAKKSVEEHKKALSKGMLADFNSALSELAENYDNTEVEIYGDFNRENYDLVDEYRTVDIRDFARHLNLKNTQVFTADSYTNIRYISPHLDPSYREDCAGVLTASD